MRSLGLIMGCSLAACLSIQGARACYQPAIPCLTIRSGVLAGVVTENGKPLAGTFLSLQRARNPHFGPRHDDSNPSMTIVASTTSGVDGKFKFGELPTGEYVISSARGWTAVKLVRQSSEEEVIRIEFFGMGCQSVAAIPSTGTLEM